MAVITIAQVAVMLSFNGGELPDSSYSISAEKLNTSNF